MVIIANRPVNTEIDGDTLIIQPLGAGREVGRSCIYMSYQGKVVLFDCGILPDAIGKGSLPFLDSITDDYVDLVLISHFHLDHCGALPVLPQRRFFDTGETGQRRTRIFMTRPTKEIMESVLHDYLSITATEDERESIYTVEQLEKCIEMMETINFHEDRWHNGIKVKCFQAGHVLGAAMFCVEIGRICVLYTGDFSRDEDRHLPAAEIPPFRPNVVICESTYGTIAHGSRKEREDQLTKEVFETLRKRGKVLMPVFALGRTQELLLLLDEYWEKHPEMKRHGNIVYLNTLAKKSMMLFKRSINMMNESIRSQVSDHNPFDLRNVEMPDSVDNWLNQNFNDIRPCVILCSPAMMENGTSRIVLERMASGENNLIILTGYCMARTVARQLQENDRIIPSSEKPSESIDVKCRVVTISFSAHSDFPGTTSFIRDTKPERVVLVHGEASRMKDLKKGLKEKLEDLVNSNLISFYRPENQQRLSFSYYSPKMVNILGRAAEQDWKKTGVISGVLVKKDLKYQLIDENDIDTFTQLKLCRILYRQHFKSRLDFNGMASLCAMTTDCIHLDGSANKIELDNVITVTLLNQQNHVYDYTIEWKSSYENDLKANALLMLILQQDSNILSPLATNTLCSVPQEGGELKMPDCVSVLNISDKEREDLIREVLEEQFGPLTVDPVSQVWKIVLPTEEKIEVDASSWEVRCDNELLSAAVRSAIDSVNQIAYLCLFHSFDSILLCCTFAHSLLKGRDMEPKDNPQDATGPEVETKKEKGVSKATAQKLLAKYKKLQSEHENLKQVQSQIVSELGSLRSIITNKESQQGESADGVAQSDEPLALIEDLKKLLIQMKKEKEETQQLLSTRNEELTSLKNSVAKGSDSKQQARYTQRISELEAELEKAKKHSAEVLEEGKALAKKQLEIETKDRALKAKLRERNEELNSVKKQLADTSFRLEKTTETVMRLQQDLQSSSSDQSTKSKKLDDLERKYDNLRQLHEEREKLYETQKAEAESVSVSLQELTTEHEKVKSELSQLHQEQDASQNYVKQMEQLVAQSTEAFNQLQSEMNSRERTLEITIQRLEEERRSLGEQVNRGEQAVSERTMELVKELDKERRKRSEFLQRISELKGEVKLLRATNSSMSSSQAQAESEAEKRAMALEAQLAAAEEEKERLQGQLEAMQESLARAEAEKAAAEREKEKVEQQWKAEVASLRAEGETQAEMAREREAAQANEVQLAQSQFELVNARYEETRKLVSLLKKQLREKQGEGGEPGMSPRPVEEVQRDEEKVPVAAVELEMGKIGEEVVFPAAVAHQEPPYVREMEQQIRAKEGKIAALEGSLERLRKDTECGASELMDLKMKIDEMEKREEGWRRMEKELYDLQIHYNELVDEYNLVKEEVMNLRDDRDLYKQQLKQALGLLPGDSN